MKAYLNSNSPLFSSVKVQVLRVPNIMYPKLRSLMGHMLNLVSSNEESSMHTGDGWILCT